MLYREIMAVCSEIHTTHINTVCGRNVELLNVKLVVHIVTTGLWRSKRVPAVCNDRIVRTSLKCTKPDRTNFDGPFNILETRNVYTILIQTRNRKTDIGIAIGGLEEHQ